jgi:spore coat protein U-like protein
MNRFLQPHRLTGCVFSLLALSGAHPVFAATTTTTFTASAIIAASCSVAATNLAFGNYAATSATALTGSSTVNVYCTAGTPYTIALNAGTGTGSTFAPRHMNNGASLMNYNLYTASGLTTVWGDASAGTSTVGGTGVGVLTAGPSTVYGSIPIGQDLPPGTYSSTITVTVNF